MNASAAPADDRRGEFFALRTTWLESLTSDRTRDAYARDLAGFHEWYGPGRSPLSARGRSFDRYRTARQAAGDQPSTLARRLSALSSFYEHALAAGKIRANPLAGVARPTVSAAAVARVLTRGEVSALERGATVSGPRAELLVALLVREGLRLDAVLGLDVEELEHLRLRSGPRSPGRPSRPAAWSRRTRQAVAAVVGTRTDGPLFLGASPTRREDARLTRFGADFILKQAAAAGGVDGPLSAGTLRRTFRSGRRSP